MRIIYNNKETSRQPTDATGYVDQHTMCRSIFYGVLQASLCSTNTNKIQIGMQYLPFGELFISQRNSTFDSRYKFTAKELDNETNYTYFGARYYDSDLSIWLSVDPLADDYPSLSPYIYCANNPIVYVDPDGRSFEEWEVLFTSNGTVEFNWVSHKGGENTQIVNFSYENPDGDHVQLIEPVAIDMTVSELASFSVGVVNASNENVQNSDNSNWAVTGALSYLMVLKIDIAFPDFSDVLPPKWAGHIVLTAIATYVLWDAGMSFYDEFSKRKGDKDYDDRLSPLPSYELARRLEEAKRNKDTSEKRRIEKEQKRRGERNAQKRNNK
jgi:RHS repeat-associated protein